jgi:N-acetylneuraminate epimerase
MTFLISTCLTTSAHAEKLPDIPVPIKNGTGTVDNNGVIYIGLGSAGSSWYKLDLKKHDKAWQQIKDFPGTSREQSISMMLDGDLFVFGGLGKENNSPTPRVLRDVYKYSPQQNSWERVNTEAPIGLTGHAGTPLDSNTALIIGGVNKNIFDNYLIDIENSKNNEITKNKIIQQYFNKPTEDYRFNKTALIYNAKENKWSSAGELPFSGTAGSSLVNKDNQIILINGEVKPGLRTDTVHQAVMDNSKLKWHSSDPLPPLSGNKYQEGLAGAFSGISSGTLLVAGGANFPGAKENYLNHKYYSHEGLKKTWHGDVYGLQDGKWKHLGKMTQPAGYGVSVNYDNDIYLLGGENNQGKPISSVTTIKIADGKLTTE